MAVLDPTASISRLGFRKWYERELLQSHAHLVLLLLAMIGLLASAEVYAAQSSLSDRLTVLACATASAVTGVWALRRYLYLLSHAEFVADQAVCAQCKAYAKWSLDETPQSSQRLHVHCRLCGHRWEITL